MEKKLINFANYLIILMPVLLITGPLLSDSAVFIIVFIFLYLTFKNKNFQIFNNKFFIFLLIFNIYISLRSLFTDEIFFSLKSSLFYFRFLILIFAVYFFLENNKKIIKYFSLSIFFTLIILCADALFQYVFGFNTFGFEIQNIDKINSFFGDESVLGSYLIRFLPLFLACFLFYFGENKKKTFVILVFFVGLVIFISGSRSSLALFCLFTVLLTFLMTDYRKYFLTLILISLSFLTILIIYFNFEKIEKKDYFENKLKYKIYYNLINPIQSTFLDNINPKNEKKIIFTHIHDSHYKTAYKMYKENKVFGVGNKMYRKLCDKPEYYVNNYSCTTHPHNTYIQILAENGIIGFISILIVFSYLIYILIKESYSRYFYKKVFLSNVSLIILVGIFVNIWPIIPSGNFYNNWNSNLLYFPVGFYLFFKKF